MWEGKGFYSSGVGDFQMEGGVRGKLVGFQTQNISIELPMTTG